MDYLDNETITATQANNAINNIVGMVSTGVEIDAVANVIDPKLAVIHQKSRQASNGLKTIIYAVCSDSTRSVDASEWELFYSKYLPMVGLTYFNNADPSQSVFDWMNNTDQNTLQQLIDASIGDEGEGTIVEFSMGLNDYTLYGNKADAKTSIKNGIIAYLTAKPKANLFLVSPPYADNDGRRTALKEIYSELSSELGLPLFDGHVPTSSLNLSSDYYLDGTHPNAFGAQRMLYWILSSVLPSDVSRLIVAEEYTQPTNQGTLNSATILAGLYDGNGIYFSNASYRCLPEFTINEIRRLNIYHKGNRTDIFFFNSSGVLIKKIFATSANNGYIYPPDGTKFVRVNISTDGTTWDALAIVPIIKYYVYARPYISFKELTSGLGVKFKCDYMKNGKIVDEYGFVGNIGQSLKIDSNDKMKWSV